MVSQAELQEYGRREIIKFALNTFQSESGLSVINILIYDDLKKVGVTRSHLLYARSNVTRLSTAWQNLEAYNSYRLGGNEGKLYQIKDSTGRRLNYKVSVENKLFDGHHWQAEPECQCEDHNYRYSKHKGNCWHVLAARILYWACILFYRHYAGKELERVA